MVAVDLSNDQEISFSLIQVHRPPEAEGVLAPSSSGSIRKIKYLDLS
jgi:hypothetical protein